MCNCDAREKTMNQKLAATIIAVLVLLAVAAEAQHMDLKDAPEDIIFGVKDYSP